LKEEALILHSVENLLWKRMWTCRKNTYQLEQSKEGIMRSGLQYPLVWQEGTTVLEQSLPPYSLLSWRMRQCFHRNTLPLLPDYTISWRSKKKSRKMLRNANLKRHVWRSAHCCIGNEITKQCWQICLCCVTSINVGKHRHETK